MGKMQLKTPIHLLDSMITYAIGVISGMQDMAQVCRHVHGWFLITHLWHSRCDSDFNQNENWAGALHLFLLHASSSDSMSFMMSAILSPFASLSCMLASSLFHDQSSCL